MSIRILLLVLYTFVLVSCVTCATCNWEEKIEELERVLVQKGLVCDALTVDRADAGGRMARVCDESVFADAELFLAVTLRETIQKGIDENQEEFGRFPAGYRKDFVFRLWDLNLKGNRLKKEIESAEEDKESVDADISSTDADRLNAQRRLERLDAEFESAGREFNSAVKAKKDALLVYSETRDNSNLMANAIERAEIGLVELKELLAVAPVQALADQVANIRKAENNLQDARRGYIAAVKREALALREALKYMFPEDVDQELEGFRRLLGRIQNSIDSKRDYAASMKTAVENAQRVRDEIQARLDVAMHEHQAVQAGLAMARDLALMEVRRQELENERDRFQKKVEKVGIWSALVFLGGFAAFKMLSRVGDRYDISSPLVEESSHRGMMEIATQDITVDAEQSMSEASGSLEGWMVLTVLMFFVATGFAIACCCFG